ncbi:hypothetical protein [Streptomyces sp. NPDC003483]
MDAQVGCGLPLGASEGSVVTMAAAERGVTHAAHGRVDAYALVSAAAAEGYRQLAKDLAEAHSPTTADYRAAVDT